MSTPQKSAPLDGCTTIDTAQHDNALQKARDANPHAGRNSTTEQAAGNLLACELKRHSAGPANLIGHGCEGDIDTGKDLGQCITTYNVDVWTPLLEPLRDKISELFLFGCSVGAGEEGAELLYKMARVINAPVSAPTGFVRFKDNGQYELEAGAVWQTATPGQQPQPIDPPAHGGPDTMSDSTGLPPNGAQVLSASYTPQGQSGPAPDHQSLALAKEVFWDQDPVAQQEEPLAKVTGHLTATIVTKRKVTETRSLLVYNHVLLWDVDRKTYHHASPDFRRMAREL